MTRIVPGSLSLGGRHMWEVHAELERERFPGLVRSHKCLGRSDVADFGEP